MFSARADSDLEELEQALWPPSTADGTKDDFTDDDRFTEQETVTDSPFKLIYEDEEENDEADQMEGITA